MFTAKVINPNPDYTFTRQFETLKEAKEWAFWGEYFVRGVSRVIITDANDNPVSWY